ncbi:charged multivesicular body protein 3 [Nephila pilipes]|uniref:Charged multivesicular body protein 3 n=1 Tax=Nephila pilipes TaxID=299642 RepID=A0A8X6UM00_NEPPI|nr:charged multivesicular body protein 3 [Nephila pilipes]
MGLFGKNEKPPKDQVREWTAKLRKEGFQLDRQIRAIQREEDKVKKTLKDAAKKGDVDVAKILAKEIIRARTAIKRIHVSKAQINSVMMSMQHQLATLRVAGSLEKSTEVMKSMQYLMKIPEISSTMAEMSKEMMKLGIVDEMMEDCFESLDDDEIEEEAQEEIDKVLWELTAGQLGTAPAAVSESLPETEVEGASATTSKTEDFADMQERLEALRTNEIRLYLSTLTIDQNTEDKMVHITKIKNFLTAITREMKSARWSWAIKPSTAFNQFLNFILDERFKSIVGTLIPSLYY